jgi:trehalose 6-phosphate synthase
MSTRAITKSSSASPPAGESGLVVVSSRLPVQWNGREWAAAAGGLVTALRPVVSTRPTRWVGWTGGSRSIPTHLPGTDAELAGVHLSGTTAGQFYDGFANATLWPLFHDLVGTPVFDNAWWTGYQRANEAFADAVLATAGHMQEPLVWIHDYHLMLLPAS